MESQWFSAGLSKLGWPKGVSVVGEWGAGKV